MFSSPARSSSRQSGRAGVIPQSSVSSGRALLQDDSDQEDSPFTSDSDPDSTATDDLSSSSNTTFSEHSKPDKGVGSSGRCGMALKFPEYVTSGGSCSNSELEDIYESDSDEETPVAEYDWDKLFAQGKKAQDESKLIRYVLPGEEEKLEDRLEDTEAAWPDYQQDILTPVNSPTDPNFPSVTQSFSEAATEFSTKLKQNTAAMDSTTTVTNVSGSTAGTSLASACVSSETPVLPGTHNSTSPNAASTPLTTTNSNRASSTGEHTHSTGLVSKAETRYGSMQSRTQEILSQRTGHPVVTAQPSVESLGSCQNNWERLFAGESARGSEQPPPYSPPRSDSLVAGVNCPASLSPGKATSYGTGDDPLTTMPITPPQPGMAIIARQPSYDHGPRRSFVMDPRSKRFFCQVCMKEIDSAVRSRPKAIAWATGLVLCCIGVLGIARCDYGCCLIPCCLDPCLIITHACPHCEAEVVQEDRSGLQ